MLFRSPRVCNMLICHHLRRENHLISIPNMVTLIEEAEEEEVVEAGQVGQPCQPSRFIERLVTIDKLKTLSFGQCLLSILFQASRSLTEGAPGRESCTRTNHIQVCRHRDVGARRTFWREDGWTICLFSWPKSGVFLACDYNGLEGDLSDEPCGPNFRKWGRPSERGVRRDGLMP